MDSGGVAVLNWRGAARIRRRMRRPSSSASIDEPASARDVAVSRDMEYVPARQPQTHVRAGGALRYLYFVGVLRDYRASRFPRTQRYRQRIA